MELEVCHGSKMTAREFKLEAVRLVRASVGVGGAGGPRSGRAPERAAQMDEGLRGRSGSMRFPARDR